MDCAPAAEANSAKPQEQTNVRRCRGIAFISLVGLETDTHRTPWRLRAVPAAVILAACMSTGCVADSAPGGGDRGAAPVVDTADTDPAPARGRPGDERQDEPGAVAGADWTAADTNVEHPRAGAALLRDVRTARHEGFDRMVLDFGDDDVPGYRVSYIDRPVRQCGSGDVVPLEGDAWLSVAAQPANAHTEEGQPTIHSRERTPRLPALIVLKMVCDFEAIVEIVAGVASPERYRVFVLSSPNRLVIDIAHPGAQ
jgi:hypothetical protein